MKRKIFVILLLINIFKAFATNSLDATYFSGDVWISQFLCWHENLISGEITYSMMEEKFNAFRLLADSLAEISERTGTRAEFYSENGISELSAGGRRYIFVSKAREAEVRKSEPNCVATENFNDPRFIIPFVCGDLGLKEPAPRVGRLYSLEIMSKIPEEIAEMEETAPIFFMPGGEAFFSPCFSIGGKNYVGFYRTKKDADTMRKKLSDRYSADCKVRGFPSGFGAVNEAYFRLARRRGRRPATMAGRRPLEPELPLRDDSARQRAD